MKPPPVVLPLLVEDSSRACRPLLAEDRGLVVWWGTRLDCEVEPTEPLRRTVVRLLRVHPLRAADALQLAAAIVWSEGAPGMPLVTRDGRPADAADRDGFRVI